MRMELTVIKSAEPQIHETAVVDPTAKLHKNVIIEPYAVIGPNCEIGEGSIIGSHAVISKNVRMGKNNHVYPNAVIGEDPQDLKFAGDTVRSSSAMTTASANSSPSTVLREKTAKPVSARIICFRHTPMWHTTAISETTSSCPAFPEQPATSLWKTTRSSAA